MNEIAATANRLGVELDAKQAREWILAVSAAERERGIARLLGLPQIASFVANLKL